MINRKPLLIRFYVRFCTQPSESGVFHVYRTFQFTPATVLVAKSLVRLVWV